MLHDTEPIRTRIHIPIRFLNAQIPLMLILILVHDSIEIALEGAKGAGAGRDGHFLAPAGAGGVRGGAGGARQLLQLPHVLPLLFGGEVVVVGRVGGGPFLLLRLALCGFDRVFLAGGAGRVERVEGEEDVEGVDYAAV